MLEGPLDMRMDKSLTLSAYDVVNGFSVDSIVSILRQFGEERFAKRIAFLIVKKRAIKKSTQLLSWQILLKKQFLKLFKGE